MEFLFLLYLQLELYICYSTGTTDDCCETGIDCGGPCSPCPSEEEGETCADIEFNTCYDSAYDSDGDCYMTTGTLYSMCQDLPESYPFDCDDSDTTYPAETDCPTCPEGTEWSNCKSWIDDSSRGCYGSYGNTTISCSPGTCLGDYPNAYCG